MLKTISFKSNQAGSNLGLACYLLRANKGITLKELLHQKESLHDYSVLRQWQSSIKRTEKKHSIFCLCIQFRQVCDLLKRSYLKFIFLHSRKYSCSITYTHHIFTETNSSNFQLYGKHLNEVKCNQLYM